MKVFGVSVMTLLIIALAYVLGAKFPGPVTSVQSML